MLEPRNHHWLPRFFLAPWCGDDGLVTSFYRPRDKVVWGRKSPKSLGSEKYLYSLQWSGFKNPQTIETDILAKVFDNRVASIRDFMLINGTDTFDGSSRKLFAQFLVLLLLRTPESIRPKQDATEKWWWETLRQIPRTIGGVTRDMTTEEAKEIYENSFLGYGRDLVLQGLLNNIFTSPHVAQINRLKWRVLTMKQEHPDLVISDHPIGMWGQNGVIERLRVPISPKALFVAGDDRFLTEEPAHLEQFREILPIECNMQQFQQARRFVVARDLGPNDSYAGMAERHLRMPDGSRPHQSGD